ncbi:MAG: hypothetical protein RLZZ458_3370 [Planctomycetota bacterium]
MARMTSLWALLGATALFAFLFYQVIAVFLLPLFLAIVVVLLLQPVYSRLVRVCRGRRYLASGLLTIAVLLAVLLPAALAILMAGHEAMLATDQFRDGQLRAKLDRARRGAGLDYPFAEDWRFLTTSLDLLTAEADRGAFAKGNRDAVLFIMTEFQLLRTRLAEGPLKNPLPDSTRLEQALQAANEAAPGTRAFQQAVQDARAEFNRFRAAVLGGPWIQMLREFTNPSPAELRRWSAQAALISSDWITAIGGATGAIVTRLLFSVLVFVLAVFFWFAEGPQLVRSLILLSPLEEKYVTQLLQEFEVLVRAVVAGSLISAFVQSLLAGIGYWLAGLDSVFLLIAATALMGMVPFVGASLVWLPAGLWLILGEGRFGAGLFLLGWGALVVSTIDNLVRPWVLLEKASLHPLAALIGVLGGAQALGPIGVFVGPLVVAFVQTLLLLLHRELAEFEADRKNSFL